MQIKVPIVEGVCCGESYLWIDSSIFFLVPADFRCDLLARFCETIGLELGSQNREIDSIQDNGIEFLYQNGNE